MVQIQPDPIRDGAGPKDQPVRPDGLSWCCAGWIAWPPAQSDPCPNPLIIRLRLGWLLSGWICLCCWDNHLNHQTCPIHDLCGGSSCYGSLCSQVIYVCLQKLLIIPLYCTYFPDIPLSVSMVTKLLLMYDLQFILWSVWMCLPIWLDYCVSSSINCCDDFFMYIDNEGKETHDRDKAAVNIDGKSLVFIVP